MEEKDKKSSWKIWLYLTPVYILIAIPLIQWTKKVNLGDVDVSKDEETVFNSSEGEIKKSTVVYTPNLEDNVLSLHYKRGSGTQTGDGPREPDNAKTRGSGKTQNPGKAQNPAARPRDTKGAADDRQSPLAGLRTQEQRGFGFKEGYLSYAVGKFMNNPKALGAILNNKYVINGFMSRDNVKAATASPQALANYLKSGTAITNFMKDSVVQSAFNNPKALDAMASSGMVTALLDTPAGKALLNNPQAMADIVTANPELLGLMKDPKIMGLLMSNPNASNYINQMNVGGGR
ncbi:MAG: hypothetical protein NTX59_01930 [Elusimicrobia bacterium]|nr:hypothetical protein [Elusimicrobiota bacterium]